MSTHPEAEAAQTSETPDSRMLIVDIGKRRRKQLRQLRKGRGPLTDRIERTLAQLKVDGVLEEGAQTVVVVVERKPKRGLFWSE